MSVGRFPIARRRQAGATLLVGMVMLLMLTLIAVGVIRLSMRHTQVVNNEQVRTEAVASANYALDLVLNSPADKWDAYVAAGTAARVNLGIKSATDSEANSLPVQVSKLECKRARVIKNGELIRKTNAGVAYVAAIDASCFGGGGSPLTIVNTEALGSSKDDSLCGTVLYEVEARVDDGGADLLGADVTVVQGVEVRRSIDELLNNCD